MQHESVMKVPNAPLVQELLRSPLLGPGGLLARWLVLGECQHSPATVSDIARRLHLARQSVQRVADVLQREGLCTYRDNPRHRRAKLVELTPAGRSALTRIEAAQRHWSDALAARIGQRVLRQAHAALAPGGRGGGAGRRAHG